MLDGLDGNHSFSDNMTKMPLYVHTLYNVNLLIHVEAENSIFRSNDRKT